MRTGDELVLETVKERTGAEPVLEDVEMGTGDMPIHDTGAGDSHFEDYPGDDFEKVGEFTPEETSQSPPASTPELPTEETLPALNRGGSGSRPWLGERIYLGFESP